MAPSRAAKTLPLQNICATCLRQQRAQPRWAPSQTRQYASESNLPRVASISFWKSLIPKPLRRTPSDPSSRTAETHVRKEWNPATIFILLGILVGSNSIQILALRKEMLNFSRKTEAKLSVLREVVQRVKEGKEVDVKKVLGTGDPQSEAEWEEVVKELESSDGLWEGKLKKEDKQNAKAERRRAREDAQAAIDASGLSAEADKETQNEVKAGKRPKFIM